MKNYTVRRGAISAYAAYYQISGSLGSFADKFVALSFFPWKNHLWNNIDRHLFYLHIVRSDTRLFQLLFYRLSAQVLQ